MSNPRAQHDEDLWLPVEAGEGTSASVIVQPAQLPLEPDVEEGGSRLTSTTFRTPGRWAAMQFRVALALETPVDRLRLAWQSERDAGVFFLWQPVFFGLGCLLYFNLPREPLIAAFPIVAVVTGVIAWRVSTARRTSAALVLLALVAAGASAAQWRVGRVDTTMLSRALITDMSGVVIRAEHRADGRVRYTIRVSPSSGGIKERKARDFEGLVRVTARKGGPVINVGEGISGKVKIDAPSGPAYPGGYSFAFQSWFDGIGASGFFLGKPRKIVAANGQNGPAFRIAQLRANMSALIRQALPGRNGGIATALIVGDRSGIDEETADILRRSGLAHILAISGLHMALVAATVISGLRLLFSLFPAVVLAYPVRKWAASAALVAATFYLVLSSANVSTQRAYIMVAIMLIAVVLDQRALTMRNVAIAAFVVLVLTPEAILSPGFQMSFAAVAALVATYETLSKRSRENGLNGRMAEYGAVRRFITRDMGGLALTSLVAGIATGIFAAYHFHRVAPLGLVANLGAMPLVSLLVMPLALVSVLAMPFGLEQFPLALMSYGTEGVVSVASWVSSRGPTGNTGFMPVSGIAFGTLALLIACLFKTRIRLMAVPLVALSANGMATSQAPNVLILENGAQIGVLRDDGTLTLMRPRAEKFSTEIWRRAFAPGSIATQKQGKGNAGGKARASVARTESKVPKQPVEKEQELGPRSSPLFQCDKQGCVANVDGIRIASVQQSSSLIDDCLLADVLVIRFSAPDACAFVDEANRPIVIDQRRLKRFGAYALTITGSSVENTSLSRHQNSDKSQSNRLTITTAFTAAPRPWIRHRHN